jgi:lysophospholipase
MRVQLHEQSPRKKRLTLVIGDFMMEKKFKNLYARMIEESISHASRSPYAQLVTPGGLTLRYGHWQGHSTAPRGTVLLLQGRGEFMEKYDETIEELCSRGMDVVGFDWRGQGLSDRCLAGSNNGLTPYYDHCVDDLDIVIKHVIASLNPGSLYVLAHSMGGHIALRYLYRHALSIAGCVLTAPMIDITTRPVPGIVARWVCRLQVKCGRGSVPVGGARQYDSYRIGFKGNRLTSDRKRFEHTQRLVAENPRLASGYVSYGWLADTFDSIDVLKRAGFAESLNVPLLVVMAQKDRVVSNAAIHAFVQHVPKAHLIGIEGSRHEILQEEDARRALFWRVFDRFIDHPAL